MECAQKIWVHTVDPATWQRITGEPIPYPEITADDYKQNQIPWFDIADQGAPAIAASAAMKSVKSVDQIDEEKFEVLPVPSDPVCS